MKHLRWITFLSLSLCAGWLFLGCENSSSDSSNSETITSQKEVIRINNGRSEIEVEGPFTLYLGNASLYRQRGSCSGFEPCDANAISIGDIAEYTYRKTETAYADRAIFPHTIRFWREGCGGPDS